jgi:threonine dehydrogenase-like Zn-dependent dehydrogenase
LGVRVKAVIGRNGHVGAIEVAELDQPTGSQILVETIVCGICGSDLHVTAHTEAYLATASDAGATSMSWDPAVGVLLGHCYVFRVLEVGPEAVGFSVGDVGAGIGTINKPDGGYHVLGFSDTYPGGYSERMLISTPGLIARLPDGMDPAHAAFLEPLLVGDTSATRAAIPDGAPAVVLGAGQVGLGIVAGLRRRGRHPIIVAEPTPLRRAAAEAAGADIVVDVANETWLDGLAQSGATQPPTIFDTTGIAGMLSRLFVEAPPYSHLFEVSAQYEPDPIVPGLAVKKNLRITFSAGIDPPQITDVLQAVASGEIDVAPWITERVGLDDIAGAFERLRSPDKTIAILVEP